MRTMFALFLLLVCSARALANDPPTEEILRFPSVPPSTLFGQPPILWTDMFGVDWIDMQYCNQVYRLPIMAYPKGAMHCYRAFGEQGAEAFYWLAVDAFEGLNPIQYAKDVFNNDLYKDPMISMKGHIRMNLAVMRDYIQTTPNPLVVAGGGDPLHPDARWAKMARAAKSLYRREMAVVNELLSPQFVVQCPFDGQYKVVLGKGPSPDPWFFRAPVVAPFDLPQPKPGFFAGTRGVFQRAAEMSWNARLYAESARRYGREFIKRSMPSKGALYKGAMKGGALMGVDLLVTGTAHGTTYLLGGTENQGYGAAALSRVGASTAIGGKIGGLHGAGVGAVVGGTAEVAGSVLEIGYHTGSSFINYGVVDSVSEWWDVGYNFGDFWFGG